MCINDYSVSGCTVQRFFKLSVLQCAQYSTELLQVKDSITFLFLERDRVAEFSSAESRVCRQSC